MSRARRVLVVEAEATRARSFGGSSVADAESIKRVAKRIVETRKAGHDVVVAVSAMGDTTDELIDLAMEVTPQSDPLEMVMLLTTGERISMALLAMAIKSMGHEARSFTGSQAGMITDARHGAARIVEVTPVRLRQVRSRARSSFDRRRARARCSRRQGVHSPACRAADHRLPIAPVRRPDRQAVGRGGGGMRTSAGVSAALFTALKDAGINMEMISTSEIRISVVTRADVLNHAVQVVHTAFGLDTDDEAVVYAGTGR